MTFDERYEQLAQEGRIYGEIEKEKIRLLDVPQIRDEIIATLKGIPDLTCELCDALDALGYCSSESAIPAHEIAPLTPSQVAVGVAVTTRSCPEQVYNIHGTKAADGREAVGAVKKMCDLSSSFCQCTEHNRTVGDGFIAGNRYFPAKLFNRLDLHNIVTSHS